MKKCKKLSLLIVVLGVVNFSANAYKPDEMGAGITLGSIQGVSFKMFFTDNFALQADLGAKVSVERRGGYNDDRFTIHINESYWMFMLNPNGVYQQSFADLSSVSFYWLAGGGLSIGYRSPKSGQFGLNAIGGSEAVFHGVPLALQVDFRPGYGLHLTEYYSRSLLDWSLNVSLRYCF